MSKETICGYARVATREQLFEYSTDIDVQAEFLFKIENGFADMVIATALEKIVPYKEFIIGSRGGFSLAGFLTII